MVAELVVLLCRAAPKTPRKSLKIRWANLGGFHGLWWAAGPCSTDWQSASHVRGAHRGRDENRRFAGSRFFNELRATFESAAGWQPARPGGLVGQTIVFCGLPTVGDENEETPKPAEAYSSSGIACL